MTSLNLCIQIYDNVISFLSAKVVFSPHSHPHPPHPSLSLGNLLVSSLFLFVYNHVWYLSFEKALTLFYY